MHRRSNLQCNQLYRDFSVNDFGVTGPIQCNTSTLPQSMRPLSNRMCGNYDYTKNGLRTYGAYPTKTCSKLYKSNIPAETKVIEETPATVTIQTTTPAVKVTEEPIVKVTEEPVLAVETFKKRKPRKEKFTNGGISQQPSLVPQRGIVEHLAPYPSSLTSYSAYPYVSLYDIPEYKLQGVPFYYADGVVVNTPAKNKVAVAPVAYVPINGNHCAGCGTLNPVLVSQERNFAVMPHIIPTVPMLTPTVGVSTRNNSVPVVYARA